MLRLHRTAGLLLCLSLAISLCRGQAGRGGISGIVTDKSGAVVPGAAMKLTDVATDVSRTMETSSSGLDSFTALVPGSYALTVTMTGFQEAVNRAVPVEVDRVSTVNFVLNPGNLVQSVDVTGSSGTLAQYQRFDGGRDYR
ncbi:MAG TPA: carboxypeptidase-like regulatory domain-containing protein [Bryobacteraceae bacterium]|jgi:hypothetical protein